MVADDAALAAVTSGPDGILAGLRRGALYIDLSTVSPSASRELAERVRSARRRRTGPPRPCSSGSVLAAAAELLLDRGLPSVSMDAVAERAGVSKATIYRWWPTKETLALDMLFTEWSAVIPHKDDSGSLRGGVLAQMRPWARLASGRPYGRVVAALLAQARTDPSFAAGHPAGGLSLRCVHGAVALGTLRVRGLSRRGGGGRGRVRAG